MTDNQFIHRPVFGSLSELRIKPMIVLWQIDKQMSGQRQSVPIMQHIGSQKVFVRKLRAFVHSKLGYLAEGGGESATRKLMKHGDATFLR